MYNTSNLNSMKRIVYMLAVLFYGTSLFAQDKPFDIEHAPAPLFRCPIYDGPTDPTLEWNAERQEWWMFYTQRRANVPNLQEVACVYGSKVGIAATKNNGKNWYYVGTANLPEPMQGQSTFWAPDVFKHKDTYYMIVTFIPGIHPFWGGDARLVFYKSKDLMNWDLVEEIEGTHGCIDASAFQMPDGTWKMWYKTPDSKTNTGVSKDLTTWKVTGKCEIDDVPHEGPIVFYWKNVVGLAQSSIWIYSIPLKHIVTAAHYNGKIPRNPFAMYHVDPDHKEREFLTLDELTAMTDIKLEDPNMAFARDLFIFGCWTGISFIDIKNLTEDNISMVNSAPWIVSKRQKTGVPFQIKLMDIPMQIVERYKSFRKGNHLFNIGNLDGINKRIKKVAVMCGIKKRVSFHVSRHSWAVLALEYGMPIESVSKILGHTNITTTQIYAKVTSTKLDHDIAVFESRIKGHLPVMGGMA